MILGREAVDTSTRDLANMQEQPLPHLLHLSSYSIFTPEYS